MKEEILNSKFLKDILTKEQWDELANAAKTMLKHDSAKNIVSNGRDPMYGIAASQPFDDEHLIALKLWTDNETLQDELYRILRTGSRSDIAQIAHWTRILTETVQCFGSRLPANAKARFWIPQRFQCYFSSVEFGLNLPFMATTSVKM